MLLVTYRNAKALKEGTGVFRIKLGKEYITLRKSIQLIRAYYKVTI